MIFQQLFPLCSCTAADRTLQITLIVPTAVCDSPEGSGARCRGTTLAEEHPTSITMDTVSAAAAPSRRAGGFVSPQRLVLLPDRGGSKGGVGGLATPTGENTHYNLC